MNRNSNGSGWGPIIGGLIILVLVIVMVMWVLSLFGHLVGITPTYHEVMNRDKQWLHRHYPNVGWRYILTALLLAGTGVAAFLALVWLGSDAATRRPLNWTGAGLAGVMVLAVVGFSRVTIGSPAGDPLAAASSVVKETSNGTAEASTASVSTASQRRARERRVQRRAAKRRAARRTAARRHAADHRRAVRVRAERRSRQRAEAAAAATVQPAPDPQASSDCDPNYVGACVPNDGADYDCGELSASDFQSVGSDPSRLDADSDGVACES
jgi:hypothetical protein